MPYNEELDARIGYAITKWGTTRKKMFGGTCYLIKGNMFCGVYKDYMILRLGKEESKEALAQSHVKPFDITGRPMKGWVMVEQSGLNESSIERWLLKAKDFVEKLPPK
jgi:TfoX/Sxy family transcriptional regulator of competence genes